jgi:hypothetical protein
MKRFLSFSLSCYLLLPILLACNRNNNNKIYSIKASIKEQRDSTYLMLNFNAERDIIFDWKVASEVCYMDEKASLLANQDSIVFLINKLKNNQLVVENKNGERKFFMNTNNCKEYSFTIYSESCYVDWFEVIINNQNDKQIKIFIPNRESLKVSCNDKQVKLYYFFKPNQKQKSMGFKNEVMESNWIGVN